MGLWDSDLWNTTMFSVPLINSAKLTEMYLEKSVRTLLQLVAFNEFERIYLTFVRTGLA